MADSIRKQITDAVMQKLDGFTLSGAPTLASGRINKSRRTAIGASEMPMYSVYFLHDTPTPVGNPRRPVFQDRKLMIETRIIVPGDDDAADPHCQWITSQLGDNLRLLGSGGTHLNIGFAENETLFEAMEGTDGQVTVTTIRWVVEYRTFPGDITRVS